MSDRFTYNSNTFKLALSVGVLSAAIVAYEIQLMHFFTIVQWHHFAYMVISIALLGFGAGGTLLSLYRNYFLGRSEWMLPFFMISSGLLMSLGVRLSRLDFLLFDSYLLFVDPSQFGRLLGSYLVFFLPFFMGSLALGLIFIKKVDQIGIYYFADMFGSGLGGALGVLLLWYLTPADLPWVIALLPVFGGLLIVKSSKRYALFFYGLVVMASCIYQGYHSFDLKPSQFKSISYALNLPDAVLEHETSSPYGLVQVVSSPMQRHAPGLSLNYSGTIKPAKVIFNNGNWFAAIPQKTETAQAHILDYTTMALPYTLGKPDQVLIFHAGAGLEVVHALEKGAKKIYAVEPNAGATHLIKGPYAQTTDSLYFKKEIKLYNSTPRSFLKQTDQSFDLIQLPLSGSFGGSVGLNALHEENLLTAQALSEMWHKLTDDGMIVFSSYIDLPPRITLKNAALIAGLLENLKISDPMRHVVAIRSWATLTYVLKKSPLKQDEVKNVIHFCDSNGFDPVLLSGSEPVEENNNSFEDEEVFELIRGMFGPERDQLIQANDFNIKIPTDNRPYFFQFLKLKNIGSQWKQLGERAAFLELGYLIVIVTQVQVLLLALVLIILPLFKLGFKGGNKAWVLLYFSGLGLGYMFLEIVLIKHLVRFLGHPIYAVATVISVMLLCSGLGSLYSSRLKVGKKVLRNTTTLIGSIILIYVFLFGFILGQTEGWPPAAKLVITLIAIGIPAFFMGMPFPMGLKLLGKTQEHLVPWAWGINGCVSVISTSLATIIAVEAGFNAVMILACLAYLISFLSLRIQHRYKR
ncbi:hypothetical protein LCM02_04990 [Lutimonas saemankumensis]|uniref:hypothetical protein n=1 Tax=Lutimonas saemankumensis TaxID=483016 RepID=UPI001CD2FED5|nr:hypothetical protein [Lutimonas saemankumensis]MCA0931798.1 hypothetical protein [Lutimonas saemankumensis]